MYYKYVYICDNKYIAFYYSTSRKFKAIKNIHNFGILTKIDEMDFTSQYH